MARSRSLSSPSLLGALSGALAAVAFLPTSVPLVWHTIGAEEDYGRKHVVASAFILWEDLQQGAEPSDQDRDRLSLTAVHTTTSGGVSRRLGLPLDPAWIEATCASPDRTHARSDNHRVMWVLGCVDGAHGRVVTAATLDPSKPARRIFALVLLLAVAVGLITAIGILRLLKPISNVSTALRRVSEGERGVRTARTGLTELDELVDQLNAAARSVEDREDSITARLELVQQLARLVAHEIRNPLQSLELLTSLIAEEENPDERGTIARSIRGEIQVLEQVVTRMLRESASKGALRLQITHQSLVPIIEQVLVLGQPRANAQGVHLSAGSLTYTPFDFDTTLVRRSVENLVLNAIQAVPSYRGEVLINATHDGEDIVLDVHDNGPGIHASDVERIFQVDVTSKAKGSGLGLSLVKSVIEAHGGTISVGTSHLGGAHFAARLPVKQESTSP